DVGDLELAPVGTLEPVRYPDNLRIVEIKPRHRVVGSRRTRLFLDRDRPPRLIEFHNAVAARIAHPIAEDRCPLGLLHRASQKKRQIMTIKNIIAEYQGRMVPGNEIAADDESLRQAVWRSLDGVFQIKAPTLAVSEQLLETRGVFGRRDDEYMAYPRQH